MTIENEPKDNTTNTSKADVLNQTRLRPLPTSSRPILQTLLKSKASGLSEDTLRLANHRLKHNSRKLGY